MAGKGGKGLLAAKTTAASKEKDKDKDKKRPVSRSSRAGIQVNPFSFFLFLLNVRGVPLHCIFILGEFSCVVLFRRFCVLWL